MFIHRILHLTDNSALRLRTSCLNTFRVSLFFLLRQVLIAGGALVVVTSCSVSDAPAPAAATSFAAPDAPRVITLAPHLTEWVYALGGDNQLVATVEHSDYPPQAKSLPKIGNAFTLNLEQIVALRPDHILYWPDGGALLQIERIRALGISVVPIRINALKDLPRAAEAICGALKCSDGHQLAETLRQRIKNLQMTYRNNPTRRTFLQVGERPLWTLGGTHLLSDALSLCGVSNIFSALPSPAAVVSPEQVVAAHPEIIILNQLVQDGDWKQPWDKWWPPEQNDAPQFIVLHPDLSLRPSPRILDAIEIVCHTLASEAKDHSEQ